MNKYYDLKNIIGLARKAGKMSIGRYAVGLALKTNKAKLIITTFDASKKIFKLLKEINNIEIKKLESKKTLGELLNRNDISIITINEEHFAKQVINLFNKIND